MDNIDYSNYTLEELFDVKRNIDSYKYPDKYQKLLEEILRKEANVTIGQGYSQFEHFDNDPISKLTDWTPLKEGGSNFKTHKLVEIDNWRIEFKPTIFFIIFIMVFCGASIAFLGTFAYPYISSNTLPNSFKEALPLIISFIFTIITVVMFYQFTIKIVFDKDNRLFWKGRKKPDRLINTEPLKNYSRFSNIHAIQLITELCYSKNYEYYSFELNLVLKDGKRINVIDHGNQDAIREDANQLALFLNIPVWEFQDEKERNFFIRLLGLRF